MTIFYTFILRYTQHCTTRVFVTKVLTPSDDMPSENPGENQVVRHNLIIITIYNYNYYFLMCMPVDSWMPKRRYLSKSVLYQAVMLEQWFALIVVVNLRNNSYAVRVLNVNKSLQFAFSYVVNFEFNKLNIQNVWMHNIALQFANYRLCVRI